MTHGFQTSGFILLPVVVTITLIAVLAFMMSYEGAMETRMAGSELESDQAQYAATAGLEHAQWRIEQNGCGPYTDITSAPLGDQSYSASITTNGGGSSITSYTVPVSDDDYIQEDTPTQNYGSTAQLLAYNQLLSNVDKRVLYRFDIENSGIPTGATVVSAVVKLFVLDTTAMEVTVHQVTADWTEAAVNWNNIAADFDDSSIAFIPGNSSVGQFVELNITPLVQAWINGSVSNQGIMLKESEFANNDVAQYTSKEYGNSAKRPSLEVKITNGSVANRADLSATGTLADGVSRTVARTDIPLYQPASSFIWQPGAELEDATISNAQKNKNFGASTALTITYNPEYYGLIRFKLSALPPTARITDARLGLYLEGGASLTNGVFDLHKVTRSWVEGVEDGANPVAGEGVTYDEYDGANAWDSSGGDYDPTPLSSLTIPDLTTGWYEWDVTAQLQAWMAGEPNYGLLLRASSGTVNSIDFTSSDSATSAQHPRLNLTLACECGESCQIPQGSGKVLLVVGDAANPAAADAEKKELFESWGYEVSYIDDDDTQAAFDSALNNADVAYVSDTVSDGNLADKLAATSKGVVNEKDGQTDNLGTSSSSGYTVGGSLEIVDTSHEITERLPAGTLPIYSAPMESVVAAGTLATGLQTLGNAAASPAIAVVEKDGVLHDGSSLAPGRRVMVPIGRSGNFNWSYLNGNGRLIVQRALEWGKTTASTSTLMKVYWTDDQGGKIQRSDPDGSNVEDVLTGLNMPTGLALDTDNGKIYWANGNHEIKRANLDGTGKETIYTDSGTVFDVALDLSAGKLYWSNDALQKYSGAPI